MSEIIIEKLTPEQERRLPEFKEKWKKIGLATDECDRDKAKYWMDKAYRSSGHDPVKEIHWVRSPKEAVTLANHMRLKTNDSVSTLDILDGFNYGCHEADYLSFYEFFFEVCDAQILESLVPQFNIAPVCGWWLPFDTCIIACMKPTSIHVEGDKLHKDLAPAIAHADNFNIYVLNGIYMPEYFVMTPADEIDTKLVLKEKNVDVRREIIKKIGYEKLYGDLDSTTIESVSMDDLYKNNPILSYEQQGDVIFKSKQLEPVKYNDLPDEFKNSFKDKSYALVEMDYDGSGKKRKFLVMDNLSIDAKHVEGVPDDIKTVYEAICFRNQIKGLPQELK